MSSHAPHSYDYQWRTPAGATLALRMGQGSVLEVFAWNTQGSAIDASPLVQANLQQWVQAGQISNEMVLRANERREFIQHALSKVADSSKALIGQGLAAYYEEISRCNMNQVNMNYIRDIALQRALGALDKQAAGMAEELPTHSLMMGLRPPEHLAKLR